MLLYGSLYNIRLSSVGLLGWFSSSYSSSVKLLSEESALVDSKLLAIVSCNLRFFSYSNISNKSSLLTTVSAFAPAPECNCGLSPIIIVVLKSAILY